MCYFNAVNEMLPTILENLAEGYRVDVLKSLSLATSLLLPTPLGVPLKYNVTLVAVAKVNGRVQLRNLPSWSDFVHRRSQSDEIKLDVDIRPRLINPFINPRRF